MFLIYETSFKKSNISYNINFLIARHNLTHAGCFCHYTLLLRGEGPANKFHLKLSFEVAGNCDKPI